MKVHYNPEMNAYIADGFVWMADDLVEIFDWKEEEEALALVEELGSDGILLDDDSDSFIVASKKKAVKIQTLN